MNLPPLYFTIASVAGVAGLICAAVFIPDKATAGTVIGLVGGLLAAIRKEEPK